MKANNVDLTSKAKSTINDFRLMICVYLIGLAIQFFWNMPIYLVFNLLIASSLADMARSAIVADKLENHSSKKLLGENANQVGKGAVSLFFNLLVGLPAMLVLTIPFIVIF